MCATIYQKPSEKTLILAPRESMQRAFDFGAWTELRMAMFFSVIDAINDNAAGAGETAIINTAADYLTFGLKNADNTTLPGMAGSRFVGIGARTGNVNTSSNFILNSGAGFDTFGYEGTTLKNGTGKVGVWAGPTNPAPSSNYCVMSAIRMVITDRGLATQSIAISSSETASGSSSYPASLLLSDMNTFASPSASRTVQWNDGVAAYPIPDSFWVRCPLYNNRIRISCIRMKRYA